MLQYPWEPYKSLISNGEYYAKLIRDGIDNLDNIDELVRVSCSFFIDFYFYHQDNDTIHLSVQNGLKHITDRDTTALATSRIPASVQNDDTIRFLIAFLYEKQLGFPEYVAKVRSTVYFDENRQKYFINRRGISAETFLEEWSLRADKIVEVMQTARNKVGNLAEDAEFIRNWALIDLGEKTGLQVTANGNSFNIGVIQNDHRHYYKLIVGQTVMMERLKGLQVITDPNRVVSPDNITIVAKNGPSEVRIKTSETVWGAPFVLSKDASRIVITSEMAYDIESTPILLPIVKRQLPDITDLNVAVTESVNLEDLFDGIRINITAVSADTNKVTVSLSSSRNTMRVVGVAVGTSKITVTATNEAGAITNDFNVTVTEGTD